MFTLTASYLLVLFLALFLTVLIELALAFSLGYRKRPEIITIICINIITNPTLNYLFLVNQYFSLVKVTSFIIILLEAVVILVEWKLLVFALRENSIKMFKLSLIINVVSTIIGILIFK